MANERTISRANLQNIEQSLYTISSQVADVYHKVHGVEADVDNTKRKLEALANDVRQFIAYQKYQNRLGQAKTEVVRLKQELEKNFGHYDDLRRTTVGVLQANDLGIVHRSTLENATEEHMIASPTYWLAPCLVALSAWLNDKKELAEKAVSEALKRDNEKASLFFALVCRRANRSEAAFKWMERYLETQEAETVSRKTLVIIDAFANGLLGVDSKHLIEQTMQTWIDELSVPADFSDRQREQWANAIRKYQVTVDTEEYPYLAAYSATWNDLAQSLGAARMHAELCAYFQGIFTATTPAKGLIKELDEILLTLVKNYEQDELSLREQVAFEELVIAHDGDVDAAKSELGAKKPAFEERKDFTQLLAEASFSPAVTGVSVSTQQVAIATSKSWILDAYGDVTAAYRLEVPETIEFSMDTFTGTTTDGRNEDDLVAAYAKMVDAEEQEDLAQLKLALWQQYMLYGGAILALYGLVNFGFLGLLCILIGIGAMLYHYSMKKAFTKARKKVSAAYQEKRDVGTTTIREIMAEVVDWRRAYAREDQKECQVLDFLQSIEPSQYVKATLQAQQSMATADSEDVMAQGLPTWSLTPGQFFVKRRGRL